MKDATTVPVKIILQSVITNLDEEEEPQRLHFSCEGTLTRTSQQLEITYKESALTEMGNTTTSLWIPFPKKDFMMLNRSGDINSSLSFSETDNRQHCAYNTPFGPFSFVVCTQKLHLDLNEQGYGRIGVEYYIELHGSRAEFNRLSILISEKKA